MLSDINPVLAKFQGELQQEIINSVQEVGRASTVQVGAVLAADLAAPLVAELLAAPLAKLEAISDYIDDKIIYANTVEMSDSGADPAIMEFARVLNGHVAQIVLDIRAIIESEPTVHVGTPDGSSSYDVSVGDYARTITKNLLDSGDKLS